MELRIGAAEAGAGYNVWLMRDCSGEFKMGNSGSEGETAWKPVGLLLVGLGRAKLTSRWACGKSAADPHMSFMWLGAQISSLL